MMTWKSISELVEKLLGVSAGVEVNWSQFVYRMEAYLWFHTFGKDPAKTAKNASKNIMKENSKEIQFTDRSVTNHGQVEIN